MAGSVESGDSRGLSDVSTSQHFDVIVIGIGAMGSSICMQLARRGRRVLGLDRHGIPNTMGSSAGDSRIIRKCYYEHPDYVPLLHRAYEHWGDLEREASVKLLHRTGALYMGPADADLLTGSRRAAEIHGLDHEMLDRTQLRDRYPVFDVPDHFEAFYEPDGGYVRPQVAITAMAEQAMHAGAVIHGHDPAVSWEDGPDGVVVRTATGSYSAAQLVISAGAWSDALIDLPESPLSVTRQVQAWVWPRCPARFAPGEVPVWGIDDPDGYFYYGFPFTGGRSGMKVARHFEGEATEAETLDRVAGPADRAALDQLLARMLPDGNGPVLDMSVCMYTNSPDMHFVVGRHPRRERVLLATGFSGHGFKFAGVVGEAIADLACEGTTSLPIEFLSPGRFG